MKIFKMFSGEDGPPEEILDRALPIVDTHHHLWPDESPIASYPSEEFRKEIAAGHNIVATVFAECMASYHDGGDEALRPVGETEFVVRTCPAPKRGQPFIAAGIIGFADLRKPAIAARTLDAHIAAGQGRFSGVRHNVVWHEREDKFTLGPRKFPRHLLLDETFRQGLKEVARRNLTYDVWMFHEQLPDLAATADALPDLTIVLDHMGGPVTTDATAEGMREVFERWRVALKDVSRRPNVVLKVGGMGMSHFGFGFDKRPQRPRGDEVAALWEPYFDVAMNTFGPSRCMTETNFPPDKHGFSYTAFWNALKILSRGLTATERANLFVETTRQVYKLKIDLPN